ncbi:RNA polymerase sigma factor [Rhizosphaericola mali]|uniref:RNA polymerase sigma factor n=1 Tax=Rhizosphaericola mali TaxID=2545455 RepID=UPI00177D7B3F|nr:sigma-70 family RNA polymerase sigma factor [Rhizosphaericola mali]
MEITTDILTHWVNKAKQGDKTSFARLYKQYSVAMFNICIRMVGEYNTAQDLLQEIFIKVFKNLHSLQQPERFGGWVKQIAVRECISHTRKKGAISSWLSMDEQEDTEDEMEETWWNDRSIEEIHKAIKSLPEGSRQIFNLFALEDYSHRQIAELLGITESTSKTQYHRAKKLLKDKLVKILDFNG